MCLLYSLPPQMTKTCVPSHSAQEFKASIKLDSFPLTVLTPQEQTGLCLCRVEEGPAGPGLNPLPLALCLNITQPYQLGVGTKEPRCQGCGVTREVDLEVVEAGQEAMKKSHIVYRHSGHLCVPTQCCWGPLAWQAGRQASVSPRSPSREPFNHG